MLQLSTKDQSTKITSIYPCFEISQFDLEDRKKRENTKNSKKNHADPLSVIMWLKTSLCPIGQPNS